jgi:hypothetical protein
VHENGPAGTRVGPEDFTQQVAVRSAPGSRTAFNAKINLQAAGIQHSGMQQSFSGTTAVSCNVHHKFTGP